ncbi:FecR family protein [Sinomicrobium soli]|uniref:FecR family protein n=1 Tax=Sinomicrobium sp. N-1-3-6 TaxID=2219864 RepID=UPI000DCE044F|nr:FecR domain-containing protein [Sinomicrobium sp. N-1-3-6]RAV27718.1 hypothetical protein DN748_16995 [Sinomicrobium sp. N-1-3-6]
MKNRLRRYKAYDVEQLLRDDYFIQWCCRPDRDSDIFWEKLQREYPHMEDTVTAAMECVWYLGGEPGRLSKEHRTGMLHKLRHHAGAGKTSGSDKPGVRHLSFSRIGMAAGFSAIALFMVLGAWYMGWFGGEPSDSGVPQVTLQLQDGSEQVIDGSRTAEITTEKGQRVGSQQQQMLVYDRGEEPEGKPDYNLLKVPYGKRFGITLSDGSRVFLNAGSSLHYPVAFSRGTPRNVYLDGEAFFEVSRDTSRPFTVITQEMETRVLGTRFNVTSYKNEQQAYTVLEEGSVGVYSGEDAGNGMVTIAPGQRALYDQGHIEVETVNVEKYTAWTRGELYFQNDPFGLVMRKLERHFNVAIESRYPELDHIPFTATFRGETLEQILNAYRLHTPFRYTRNGNTIVITAP